MMNRAHDGSKRSGKSLSNGKEGAGGTEGQHESYPAWQLCHRGVQGLHLRKILAERLALTRKQKSRR